MNHHPRRARRSRKGKRGTSRKAYHHKSRSDPKPPRNEPPHHHPQKREKDRGYYIMKAPTTATIRAKHLETLAKRSENYTENPTETISRAARAMNSFYRLAEYSERLFNINNTYDLYQHYQKNGRLDRMEERESAWIKRVNGYLQEFHARAVYNGIYPSICEEKKSDDHGCIVDLFLTAWY